MKFIHEKKWEKNENGVEKKMNNTIARHWKW